MQVISAKDELKNYFNIELTPKQKLEILEYFKEEFKEHNLWCTNSRQRIPGLAIKQVLDECVEILKAYYSVDKAIGEEE